MLCALEKEGSNRFFFETRGSREMNSVKHNSIAKSVPCAGKWISATALDADLQSLIGRLFLQTHLAREMQTLQSLAYRFDSY